MTGCSPTEAGSPLWLFSLAFYARPGVAAACLRCQDEAGADVNLVLLALWGASAGHRLEAGEIAALDTLARSWRQGVVEPLRYLRRRLKIDPILPGSEAFRTRIKAAELEAERLLQEALFAALPVRAPPSREGPDPPEIARLNLLSYEAACRLDLPGDAAAVLLARFAEAFPPRASA